MTTVQRPVVRGARSRLGAVLVFGAVVGGLVACSSDSAGAEALLEPASSLGTDPFTASVAVTPVADFPTDVQAVGDDVLDVTAGEGAAVEGTTPGLYGGSGDAAVCDTDQLVEFLEGDEAKPEAWAGVFDIDPDAIGTFIAGLTPVYLTVDTVVTNHGFRDGQATAFTSVLEAGTAVLVDSGGVPRVKCGCGNPLAPAPAGTLDDVDYVGDPWGDFEPDTVVEVQPGPPADSLEVVDLETGDPIEIPVGTADGETQGFVMISRPEFDYDATTISTSPDGVTWTEVARAPDLPEDVAEGPDGWLGLGPGSQIRASEDLESWTPVATEPVGVFEDFGPSDIAFGNGRYVLVGAYSSPLGDFFPGAFTSADGVTWSQSDLSGVVDEAALSNVTFIDDGFVASGGGLTIASSDGESWEQLGEQQQLDEYAQAAVVAGGGGTLLRNEYVWCNGDCDRYSDNTIQEGLDGPLEPVTDAPFDESPIVQAAYGDGQFLTTTWNFWSLGDDTDGVYTSADGRDWERVAPLSSLVRPDDTVYDLAYGTISSGEDTSPAPAGGDTDLRSVDWANRAYEACEGISEDQPVQFEGGGFQSPIGGFGSLGEVSYGDADGDGAEDALVPITCSAGTAGGTTVEFRVFSATPDGPQQLGEMFSGAQAAAADGTIADGAVQVTQDKFLPGDPFCCPSGGKETITWTYQGGQWVQS